MANSSINLRVLAVCFSLLTVGVAEGKTSSSVSVEVFGYAEVAPGRPVSELHRQAVRDALENAVMQAQVELDVQVSVAGLRVKDRRVRSRSMGRVESSRVLTSGFVQSTNSPAVYRVRMEVFVRPIPTSAVCVRGLPAVVLSVRSNQGEEHANTCREVLAASLRECGIRVADAESDPLACPVEITLFQSSSNALWEIQWKMGHSLKNPSFAAQEYLQVPTQDLLSSTELDKLGVRMAQDALRLWSK